MTAEMIERPVFGQLPSGGLDDVAAGTLERLARMPVVQAGQPGLVFSHRYSDGVKRVVDIVGAAMLLLAALPVMLVIALAIFLESGRPIFYRARRVGLEGAPIYVLKFRSMFPDAEARLARLLEEDPGIREEFERTYKIRQDPRITRVGGFLRRTSLDELPQFWNVLMGSMSLVGPRPVTANELSMYETQAGGRESYLAVRPGVTGLWQVSGRSGTTYQERISLDRRYVAERGLRMDLAILARTPGAVIRGDGAF